jgi:hypothetical protein
MFSSLSLAVKQIMYAVEYNHDMHNDSDYIFYYSGRSMNE